MSPAEQEDWDTTDREFGELYMAMRQLCNAEENVPAWKDLPLIAKQQFTNDTVLSGLASMSAQLLDRVFVVYSSQVN